MMVHPLQCQSLQRSLHLQERRCAKHLLWASGRTLLVHTPQAAAVSQTLTVNWVKQYLRHRSALTIIRVKLTQPVTQPVTQHPHCAATTVPVNTIPHPTTFPGNTIPHRTTFPVNTIPHWTRPARKRPERKSQALSNDYAAKVHVAHD